MSFLISMIKGSNTIPDVTALHNNFRVTIQWAMDIIYGFVLLLRMFKANTIFVLYEAPISYFHSIIQRIFISVLCFCYFRNEQVMSESKVALVQPSVGIFYHWKQTTLGLYLLLVTLLVRRTNMVLVSIVEDTDGPTLHETIMTHKLFSHAVSCYQLPN